MLSAPLIKDQITVNASEERHQRQMLPVLPRWLYGLHLQKIIKWLNSAVHSEKCCITEQGANNLEDVTAWTSSKKMKMDVLKWEVKPKFLTVWHISYWSKPPSWFSWCLQAAVSSLEKSSLADDKLLALMHVYLVPIFRSRMHVRHPPLHLWELEICIWDLRQQVPTKHALLSSRKCSVPIPNIPAVVVQSF